jgi:cellulose biosynthesis protein BcsS
MKTTILIALAILLGFSATPPGAMAAYAPEAIAGWEGDWDSQGYGFLILGLAPDYNDKLAFPVRIEGSYLYYHFDEQGEPVSVRAPGAAAMAGVRIASSGASVTAMGGADIRWERRRSSSQTEFGDPETRTGMVGQLDFDAVLARRLRPDLLLHYSGAVSYVYARLALRWQCSNLDWSGPRVWFVGIEGIGQGNEDTEGVQAGAILECAIVPTHVSISLRGGYKETGSDRDSRFKTGYIGVGLYRRF